MTAAAGGQNTAISVMPTKEKNSMNSARLISVAASCCSPSR